MRATAAPSLTFLVLGVALFFRTTFLTTNNSTPKPHIVLTPNDRVPLARFIIEQIRSNPDAPLDTAAPSTKIAIDWPREDSAQEQTLSIPRNALEAPVLSRIAVFPRLGLVFCPVPGVASESLISALSAVEGITEIPNLGSYAPRDAERFLTRSEVVRALFVRHPFTRALSTFYRGRAFADRHGLEHPSYRNFMSMVRGHPLATDDHELEPVNLLFFLTFIASQRKEQLWEPLRPVKDLCGLGIIDYGFVGRFESLDKHLKQLSNRLGVKIALPPRPLPPTNASETVREMFGTRSRRDKAAKLYKEDLDLLDYNIFT